MKKNMFLPVTALAGGIAALVLRLLQNRIGFEVLTGLAIRGAVINRLLPVALLLLAILLFLSARQLQKRQPQIFPQGFQTENLALLTLAVCGIFLVGISGALEFAVSLGIPLPFPELESMVFVNDRLTLRMSGMLSLLSAVSLFPAAAACRKHEGQGIPVVKGALLLVPVVCLVVRLVLVYRIQSINPVLSVYYIELLAMVLITLALYRLSAFAFSQGNPRLFGFYTCVAVVLSIAHIGDGFSIASLLYLGFSMALFAFLLILQAETDSLSAEDAVPDLTELSESGPDASDDSENL